MGRMINPQYVAYDPSFDPGQPFIVPFLTTFVGVRTKMNMRLMEERIKRADPSRWYEMATALRANAADLRKQALDECVGRGKSEVRMTNDEWRISVPDRVQRHWRFRFRHPGLCGSRGGQHSEKQQYACLHASVSAVCASCQEAPKRSV